METTPVERDEVAVMFIRTTDDVSTFGPTWARLEELVGTRGRKFYGAFYPPAVYDRIAPTFKALLQATTSDESRPSIEFYRRFDEIDLLLPVLDQ